MVSTITHVTLGIDVNETDQELAYHMKKINSCNTWEQRAKKVPVVGEYVAGFFAHIRESHERACGDLAREY